MTSPTPIYGFHYPDSADDLNVGAINIQELAEDVEATLAAVLYRRWLGANGDTAATTLANAVVPVVFEATAGDGAFTTSDNSTYVYTGPPGAWFLLGCNADLMSSAAAPDTLKVMELRSNGGTVLRTVQHGHSAALGLTWIGQLNTGDYLNVIVQSTNEDGYYARRSLWAAQLPGGA